MTDNYRLVTVLQNNICFFLFAGKYDETDHYIGSKQRKIFTLDKIHEVIGETNVSTKDENFFRPPDFLEGVIWDLEP